jgi:citronellol/citronellal dehydrogenase
LDLHFNSKTMNSFSGRTVFITGASRGIGKAIGLRLAAEGARIAVTGKTAEPHPKLDGTIHTAAEEIRAAGGEALAIEMDVRSEEQVVAAVAKTIEVFGGIDILINNASAIRLEPTEQLDMKYFDLMHDVNLRGTFLSSKYCIPHLRKSSNPHILNLSPPLNFEERWFAGHTGYSMAKFGMSLCVLGMAGELRKDGIAVNALWPATTIATAAIKNLLGGESVYLRSRWPSVVADAAAVILRWNSRNCTGNYFIDEQVLRAEGVTDFSPYSVDPTQWPMPDFFI